MKLYKLENTAFDLECIEGLSIGYRRETNRTQSAIWVNVFMRSGHKHEIPTANRSEAERVYAELRDLWETTELRTEIDHEMRVQGELADMALEEQAGG